MESNYNAQHKEQMDRIVLNMRGITSGKMFGYPGYKVKGKVFAFVGGDGIALKLPRKRVRELISIDPQCHPFEPTPGKIWQEWVSIDREYSEDYLKDEDLIEESMRYVSEKT